MLNLEVMFKRCDYVPEDYGEKTVTFEMIIRAVESYAGEPITVKSRRKPLTYWRAMAYALGRLCDIPLTKLARTMGGRDHSTVIHAIDNIHKPYMEGKFDAPTLSNYDYQRTYKAIRSWIYSPAEARQYRCQECQLNLT